MGIEGTPAESTWDFLPVNKEKMADLTTRHDMDNSRMIEATAKQTRAGQDRDKQDMQNNFIKDERYLGSSVASPAAASLPSVSAVDEDYLDDSTLQMIVDFRLGCVQEEAVPVVVDHMSGVTSCGTFPSGFLSVGQRRALTGAKATKVASAATPKEDTMSDPTLPREVSGLVRFGEQPGAFSDTPGGRIVPMILPNYSLLGRESNGTTTEDIAAALARSGVNSPRQGEVEDGVPELHPSNLTVATLLQDEDSGIMALPVAREYASPQEIRRSKQEKERENKKKDKAILMTVAAVLAISAAVILLVSFLVVRRKSTTESPIVKEETAAPTLCAEDCVKSILPNSTLRILNLGQEDAPQSKAYQWILHDPSLSSYSEERLKQRFALATFYYSTSGPSWRNQTNWLSYSNHECTWFHRKYFEDVELYLASATARTFKLMYHSNDFPCSENTTGSFEHLWLYKNKLDGSLPIEELSLLSNLKSMSLFANELEITFSSELGKLRALEGIEISSLGADGTIPTEIGLLTNLKTILASSNELTGTIPTEFGLLQKLEYSMLSQNHLSGSLPTQICIMSSLAWLYLYENQITGSIPSCLGLVTTLEFLNMFTNELTGPLPTEIGQLTRMNLMSLTDNFLTGELPSELGKLTEIKQGLALSQNVFVGSIPSELGAITAITGTITGSGTYGLGLGGNSFTGILPSELGKLSLLARLYVEDNELTGSLPSEMGSMTKLETLEAQNNRFIGSIPDELEMVFQALNSSNAEDKDWNVSNNVKWDLSGNSGLSGTIADLLCVALVINCSRLLCGCDCSCPAQ